MGWLADLMPNLKAMLFELGAMEVRRRYWDEERNTMRDDAPEEILKEWHAYEAGELYSQLLILVRLFLST